MKWLRFHRRVIGREQQLELTLQHVRGRAYNSDGYRSLGEAFSDCREFCRTPAEIDARKAPCAAALHQQDAVRSHSTHPIRTVDWATELHLCNRAMLPAGLELHAE